MSNRVEEERLKVFFRLGQLQRPDKRTKDERAEYKKLLALVNNPAKMYSYCQKMANE